VQKLSHVFAVYMCVTYMSCSACAKTLLLFCVYEQRLCHVFAIYVIMMHVNQSENRNWLIYCVTQMCMCAKAESCLRNVCVYEWHFNNSSLTERSSETYNNSLYFIISWLFNVQASTSLFHILIISFTFSLIANSSSYCKILMSSTMNLLLKLYIISWIISILTIAHETSYLQSTVSVTELSCFSVTLQSLWINISSSCLLKFSNSDQEILSLEKYTSFKCIFCIAKILTLSSILLICIAEHVLMFSLTL